MKQTIALLIVVAIIVSTGAAVIYLSQGSGAAATSTIYGDYAYKGGTFFINMVEQAGDGKLAQIYGTFQYLPDENKIDGTVTITIMDTRGDQLAKYPGKITYTNGVLEIVDDKGRVYYRYAAPSAREAFWKGLPAVYEYEMHRNIKLWRKITIDVVNPQTGQVQGTMTAYQVQITPTDKFEVMNLGQFGLVGPFNYYITKIVDPRTGIIVSVKLVVLYNGAVIFSQEVGIAQQQ